ncbi:hypothetical protein CMQ_3433 [Grosmannia clavigera kw1407]|uniref:Clr5 domain-containing protein n=1 Tax=Grosmannia clavigera (strain kw1407 / UAMH 11150) TaxID=655863 RepID=F0X855_GROCL|nr:uncharacterized protein CMQ_3433 [Grosmannia clavigera kw1407]EFX05364.1 hypothetical protein CMQ_3433 [Grosmannia clavigera kw1407]
MAWNNSSNPSAAQRQQLQHRRHRQHYRLTKAFPKVQQQQQQQQQQNSNGTAMPPSPTSSDDAHCGGSRRRQWQWARSADWDMHRARITELYRDRGLHLDQVIEIMAREHGFYASPRMYKTRISKWAIDKNYKAADVACMLLLKRQRAAQGKASSFVLRGRRVDWAKIEQYLKRDSTLLHRLEAGDDLLDLVPVPSLSCSASSSPASSACSSALPPLPPPHTQQQHQTPAGSGFSHLHHSHTAPLYTSLSSSASASSPPASSSASPSAFGYYHYPPSLVPLSSVASSVSVPPGLTAVSSPSRGLAPPLEVRLSEELARLTRDYCLGAFDKGLWVRDSTATAANNSCCNFVSILGSQDGADRLRLWGQKMRLGHHLIGSGSLDDGFRRVGLCMDELRQHVQEEDPSLLFHLMGLTFGHTPNFRALAATLCGHIRELTHIVLGAAHPLTRIFVRLATVVTSDAHFAVLALPMQCMADLFMAQDATLSLSLARARYRSQSVPTVAVSAVAASFSASQNHPDSHPLCGRFSQLLLGSKRPLRITVPDSSAAAAGVTASLSSPPSSPVVKTEPLHGGSAASPAIVRYPIRGALPAETQAELQSMVGALETSRNIHVRMRFYHIYLAYLSRVALAAATGSDTNSAIAASAMATSSPGGTSVVYHGMTTDSSILTSSQVATATSAAIAAAAAAHSHSSPPFLAASSITPDSGSNSNNSTSGYHGNSAYTVSAGFAASAHDYRTNLLTMRESQYFYILGVDVTQPESATAPPLASMPSTPTMVVASGVDYGADSGASADATPRTLVPVPSHKIMCASGLATEMTDVLKKEGDYDMTGNEASMSCELEDLVNVKWVLP